MTWAISPGERATALRRDLGPVAWCALECLVERSDAGQVVAASVRLVAAELGVAKNTAHRALRALNTAGLVDAVQQRTVDGRFRAGHYRLHLDHLVVRTARPVSRARRRPAPAADVRQLALLPGA